VLRYCSVESLTDTAKITNAISLSHSSGDNYILMFRIPGSKTLWLKVLYESISFQKNTILEDLSFLELEKKGKGRFNVKRGSNLFTKKKEDSGFKREKEGNRSNTKEKFVIDEEEDDDEESEDFFDFFEDIKIKPKDMNTTESGDNSNTGVVLLPLDSLRDSFDDNESPKSPLSDHISKNSIGYSTPKSSKHSNSKDSNNDNREMEKSLKERKKVRSAKPVNPKIEKLYKTRIKKSLTAREQPERENETGKRNSLHEKVIY